jgi:hypothetical protein
LIPFWSRSGSLWFGWHICTFAILFWWWFVVVFFTNSGLFYRGAAVAILILRFVFRDFFHNFRFYWNFWNFQRSRSIGRRFRCF